MSPKINVSAALYPNKLILIAFKKTMASFSIYIIELLLFLERTDPWVMHIAQQAECRTQKYVPIGY